MLTRSEIAAQIREWAKRIHCLDIVVYDEMRALAARLEAETAGPTLAELLKQIAAEHRTNGIYEEDGRYAWPARWNALWTRANEGGDGK